MDDGYSDLIVVDSAPSCAHAAPEIAQARRSVPMLDIGYRDGILRTQWRIANSKTVWLR
jgi:hypothetical protein